jgi:hypothetical protein
MAAALSAVVSELSVTGSKYAAAIFDSATN